MTVGPVPDLPNAQAAREIAEHFFGARVRSCDRFPTGLRHWVYDVTFVDSDHRIVVRLSHPDHRDELAGGVFWHDRLAGVGVPVAQVIGCDVAAEQPFMILERLAGTDIGNVIDAMTSQQIRRAAAVVADMHRKTAALPLGNGFGYALDDRSPLHPTWRCVLEDSVERAQEWINSVGVIDDRWVERVRTLLDDRVSLLDGIEPMAFLHDATTKNVIVDDCSITGLVDVDQMAFGDPLWTVALTRMSLLSARRPTDYADEQIDAIEQSADARKRVDVYTALHCLSFLGELGQTFNRDEPAPIDRAHQAHLEAVLSSYL